MSSSQHSASDQARRALLESEARLQQVVDNSTAVIFTKDREGRYLLVNREFERVMERKSADVLGRTDREIFPPQLAARFRHNDLRVLLERRPIEFEETGVFLGESRTFISSKFPLLDADGVPYAVCAIATDITDRKRIEDALSRSALAVSTAEGDALFAELARYLATILDVECALIAALPDTGEPRLYVQAWYLNGTVRERFDYPLAGTACETVLGRGFRCYPSGVASTFPDDEYFRDLAIESYAGYPLNDANGRALGVISILSRKPLTRLRFVESVLKIFAMRASAELERAKADATLRASEASYRGIFESSGDAIFVHDWDTGAIVDVNPRACEAYGYTYAEMLNLGVDDLSSGQHPFTGAEAARFIEQAKTEGSAHIEWHRRNKDGSLHWDEVHLKRARIGGVPRILAFTREITERKQAEERRARLEARLRQAEKMEAIGQLTGGIAHDFNNLLTTIMGYIVLAVERQAGVGDPRLESYLNNANLACERAQHLIEQMLMFSRGQRGAPRPLSLAPRVRQALELLKPASPASIKMEADLDADVAAVMLDPVQLEQVLLNLCVNARDALGDTGTIRVAVRTTAANGQACASCRQAIEGEKVELVVEDDGPGMPPEVLERVFEPFFSTKEVGRGAGMGLATLHGIVHEHGGHVLVETAPGQGARFKVLFPPLQTGERRPPTELAAGSEAAVAQTDFTGRVLVVDDEKTVGEFMRELLETWGLESTFVASAHQAFEVLAQTPHRFDLVITDHAMPELTGLELARALKAVRPNLPVVLYTGFRDQISAEEMRAAGVRAVLAKPVQPQKLAAVLREALRGVSADLSETVASPAAT